MAQFQLTVYMDVLSAFHEHGTALRHVNSNQIHCPVRASCSPNTNHKQGFQKSHYHT